MIFVPDRPTVSDGSWRATACRRRFAIGLLAVSVAVSGAAAPPADGQESATAPAVNSQKTGKHLADLERPTPLAGHSTANLDDEPEARAHYDAARKLFDDRKFGSAIEELDAALKLARGQPREVLLLMARTKRAMGRTGEARLAAEHAASLYPGSIEVHYLLAELDREQARWDEAIAHLRAAASPSAEEADNPLVTAAWYALGDCLAEEGYLTAAAEAFAQFDRGVWESRPDHRSADEVAAILKEHPYGMIERRLELLRKLNRTADVTAAVEEALATRPDEPYLRRLYVRTLLDVGQAARAFDYCRQRLEAVPETGTSQPTTEPAAAELWSLALEAARAADGLGPWVNQLQTDVAQGQHLELAARLARRFDEAGDWGHAVPLWRASAQAQPQSADCAWALARALKEAGDLPAGLTALIEYVRSNPDTATIPAERFDTWMRNFKATDEFLRLVGPLAARSDSDFATFTVLGATAAAAGQPDLAERLFRSALDARPNYALAHVAWGRALLATYRWEEAKNHARQAIAAAPDLAAAHLLLADAHEGLDEYKQAESAYKAALEHHPGDVAYVMALARHYRRVANRLAAQRYLQQVWSMDRTSAEAVEVLVDTYLESGKLEVARQKLAEAEASDLPEDALRRLRTTLRFAESPLNEEHLAELARQYDEHPADIQTGLKLAAGWYLRQRPEEAKDLLRRLQARDPDHEDVLHLLARVDLRLCEGEQAVALLEEQARRHPARIGVLSLLAESYLAEFRFDEARDVIRRLITLDVPAPQRQQWQVQLLETYLRVSEFNAALELVERWREAEPQEAAWERARLRVLLAAGRKQDAVEHVTRRMDEAARHYAEAKEARDALAQSLKDKPDDAATAARLKGAELELQARLEELYTQRGEYVDVCQEAGESAAAEQRIRAWLDTPDAQPVLHEWLAQVLLRAKRFEDALDAIKLVIPRAPDDVVKVITWRAQAYAGSGKLDQALNDLKSLLSEAFVQGAPRTRAEVRRTMIALLLDAHSYDQAVSLSDDWLKNVPKSDQFAEAEVLSLKRLVLQAADRMDEHDAVAQQLLDLEPAEPGVNNDLGYTWADRGVNLERALRMIKLAVATEPLNAAFLDSLGWVYYKMGRFDPARLYLARAVRLRTGQDPVVFDHLGDAEYRLGDQGAARQRWEMSLKLAEAETETEGEPGVTTAPAREQGSSHPKLIPALRLKLSALDKSERPAVAPIAGENPSEGTP